MGRGACKRNNSSRNNPSKYRDYGRDITTLRVINDTLAESPVNVGQLRKIAAVRGLVNNQVRSRVWAHLLGVDPNGDLSATLKLANASFHRDERTVQADVERSLYGLAPEDANLQELQQSLKRLLTGVLATLPDVHYYQGLHDIAGVLLLVLGEEAAYVALHRLVQHHLRDFTRPTLDAAMRLLELLPPLLQALDPALAHFISASGCPPWFGVAQLITWHSHGASSVAAAARVLDACLAGPPLLPLYLTAAVLRRNRSRILALPCELSEVHSALQHMELPGGAHLEEMCQMAFQMARAHPPHALAQQGKLQLMPTTMVTRYPFQYMQSLSPPSALSHLQVRCQCDLCNPDQQKLTVSKYTGFLAVPVIVRAAAVAVAVVAAASLTIHDPDKPDSYLEQLVESFAGDIL